ncbi:MAG: O-antigen ligase family protein [Acidobacteria bacterium]|nr:O-antigen ligase family protein [Acidobacteriota bacterium]
MSLLPDTNDGSSTLEVVGVYALLAFIAALQVSIAASQILLTIALGCWVGVLVNGRERPHAPPFFAALMVYATLTLLSVLFSRDPGASIVDAKEILLFLVVPLVFRLARGKRAQTVATVVVTVGAATAVFGVVQYGILEFDNLGQRPSGSMGHYMTYSGLLTLVIALAGARALFDRRERVWSVLVIPALLAALAVTLTRSYMIGAAAALGVLCLLRDRRLLVVAPMVAALLIVVAPPQITDRFYSSFDMEDPTVRDRFAMSRSGIRIIGDHPWTGVGPDMVKEVYADYKDPGAVQDENPHLHNVPLQIAAERGLPALAAWLLFLGMVVQDLARRMHHGTGLALPAAGLAAVAGMLVGGMFEYNFGDSEFLMLFLVLITLPAAAACDTMPPGSPPAPRAS